MKIIIYHNLPIRMVKKKKTDSIKSCQNIEQLQIGIKGYNHLGKEVNFYKHKPTPTQ